MTNVFGGKNSKFLYTPLSPDELEVIERWVTSGDLRVVLKGWGSIASPLVVFGDARLTVRVNITLNAPAIHVPVWYLDMELWTISTETLLYQKRESTMHDGMPLHLGAKSCLIFDWSVWIKKIDPEIVKRHKPGAHGLTSRLDGSWSLTEQEAKMMYLLNKGERTVRDLGVQEAVKATKEENKAIKMGIVKKVALPEKD